MKKIMFVALALLMGLASCVKDKQYPGITISNVTYNPLLTILQRSKIMMKLQ